MAEVFDPSSTQANDGTVNMQWCYSASILCYAIVNIHRLIAARVMHATIQELL
jgi:hypothetical protein